MKKLTRLFALAALLGAFGLPNVVAAVVWTSEYTGDALPNVAPSDPLWTSGASGPDHSASVSDGILNITTGSKASTQDYTLIGGTGLDWDPTGTGSTLEVRMKVNSVSSDASYAQRLAILTGDAYFQITWNKFVVVDLNSSASASVDAAEFHTYRFAIDGTNKLTLYIDDNPTPAFTGVSGSPYSGSPLLLFGVSGAGYESGSVDWDYISWTNAGAFAPVPEPSSLALVGLAVGALLMRVRRKA